MQFLGWRGGHRKSKIKWGCLKGGELRYFEDLRASWRKREGGVFGGIVDTPMHPVCIFHGRHVSVREIGNIMSYVFLTA